MQIEVGLMDGSDRPTRGSRVVIEVAPDSSVNDIMQKAVWKMSFHNTKFNSDVKYSLHYPDGRLVVMLPEKQDVTFTLSGYKAELMKDYSKICLFLKQVEGEDG